MKIKNAHRTAKEYIYNLKISKTSSKRGEVFVF
jgi:hypothetical protein